MTARLRKMSGSDGAYVSSGGVDGLEPGRPVVTRLRAAHVGPNSDEGLQPLVAFTHLEILELEDLSDVDLSPLCDLRRLDVLSLAYLRDLDLDPLGRLPQVRWLTLGHLRDCRIPERLTLPSSLEVLGINNSGPQETGEPVKQLIEAIDWSALGGLRELQIAVGGMEDLPAIEVDLGFLRHLRRLERLDIPHGVSHGGDGSSPLEPPFDGLPQSLRRVRIDAWEPGPLAAAMGAY